MKDFEVVFLGGGGVAVWAEHLIAAGLSVAVIEQKLVGGECPYFACMPSKALLHYASILNAAKAMGLAPHLKGIWNQAIAERDRVADFRDDSSVVKGMQGIGIEVIRGKGRVVGPGEVEVNGERLAYKHLVIDTGSRPDIPDVPGLSEVPTWTSDQSLSSAELPASLAIIGGGAVGCEMSQVYARFGCKVTMILRGQRPLSHEEPVIGDVMSQILQADGVEVRFNSRVTRAEASQHGARLHFENSEPLEVERVLIATGRRPNVDGIGLELLGIEPPANGLAIDDHCHVTGHTNIWAGGDVTGIAPYTHTANYQAKAIIANIVGGNATVEYSAIPRAVFTDPAMAATGLTVDSARKQGIDVVSSQFDLTNTARASADRLSHGVVVTNADAKRGTLIGAAAIAPGAGELIGQATTAIVGGIPIGKLAQVVQPFPTFAEGYTEAIAQLQKQLELQVPV